MTIPDSKRLRVSGLCVVRQSKTILNGLDLDLDRGESLSIIGPSGCGKSTLLRVLSLLEPYQAGQIWLDGSAVESFAFTQYRRRVSLLLQDAPMFAGTVADNLRFGPALVGKVLDDSQVCGLLERVSLSQTLMKRDASELSGGERQRVALARSLANDPSILLLDEPTSALDPQSASEVIAQLRMLSKDGLSVVAVMHVPEHVALLGGRVLKVSQGRLVDKARS